MAEVNIPNREEVLEIRLKKLESEFGRHIAQANELQRKLEKIQPEISQLVIEFGYQCGLGELLHTPHLTEHNWTKVRVKKWLEDHATDQLPSDLPIFKPPYLTFSWLRRADNDSKVPILQIYMYHSEIRLNWIGAPKPTMSHNRSQRLLAEALYNLSKKKVVATSYGLNLKQIYPQPLSILEIVRQKLRIGRTQS